MPRNPDSRSQDTLIEVFDNLVPAHLHMAAWATCTGKNWYFGHSSGVAGHDVPFWKMDLEGDEAFTSIWNSVKTRCEELAAGTLRIIRVYANGHTYGQGGGIHPDDNRSGTFTLLYYPNPEWNAGWDGDTLFYDEAGDVRLAVRLKPNRAVFFDSRIPHVGRPPSRACSALRVTVAFKLERCDTAASEAPAVPAEAAVPAEEHGIARVYYLTLSADTIRAATEERLASLANSVSLPGFRPGQAPMAAIEARYGAQVREDVVKGLGEQCVVREVPPGSVVTEARIEAGVHNGVTITVHATWLPALPDPLFSSARFEKLSASDSQIEELGLTQEAAAVLLRSDLKIQVLDWLHSQYSFPVPAPMLEKELANIRNAAGPASDEESKKIMEREFRAIAERRVRLGFVVSELARRNQIAASSGAELEDLVIDRVLASSDVRVREVSPSELREMTER